MTAETIHTCSYSCERPGCIRAQRDYLAARLAVEGEKIMVDTPYGVFILPLQPSGLDGEAPRFVVHVPETKPAAVDDQDAQVAEVEALRAEVERLRADRDSWEQQAADRLADWHAEHLRAEKLAASLRLIESAKDRGFGIDYARGVAQSTLRSDRGELAQENRNDC